MITYLYYKLLVEIVDTGNADPEDLEMLIEDSLRNLADESGIEIRVLDFEETNDEDIIR